MSTTNFQDGLIFDFYKPRLDADETVIFKWEPSLTRQEFAEDCDINTIMKRFESTGQFPGDPQPRVPQYLDLTVMPADLMAAMDMNLRAEQAFMSLPATVRREFDNDPIQFVEFASDPENLSQMRTWGLAPPEKVPDAPMRVEVVNPAPPPQEAPPAK